MAQGELLFFSFTNLILIRFIFFYLQKWLGDFHFDFI
jgi:hypothetical protein